MTWSDTPAVFGDSLLGMDGHAFDAFAFFNGELYVAHRGLVEVLAVGSRTLAPKYRLTNPCATEFDPAVTLHLDDKRLGVRRLLQQGKRSFPML